jgi:TfoX/Sxy family transcriptional regulator of competence genes
MSSKQSTIDFLVLQMKAAGEIRVKKMFGEYGIYCDEKIVALVCDDQLFIKPTETGEQFIGEVLEGFPYPGAKPYFLISEEKWSDKKWLAELIQLTAAALPPPKKKS